MLRKLKLSIIFLAIVFSFVVFTPTFASSENGDLSGGEIKSMTVQEVADFYKISADDYANGLEKLLNINVESGDSIQTLHDNMGLEPSAAKGIAESLVSGSEVSTEQVIETKTQEKVAETANPKNNYFFLEITLVTLFLYSLTWVAAKIGKIKLITHRKIWNWIMLGSFVPAGIMGLMIALKISYGIGFNLPFSLTYWHTVGGIAMAEIAILHIAWHTRYYLNFKKK